MKNKERKYFSIFDIFIILLVATISLVVFVSQFYSTNGELECVIKVKGEVVNSVPLSKVEEPLSFMINGEYPLTVYITESSARIGDASCPDKLCEHSKEITRSGQSVVCLPAKVSVTLQSETQENVFDAVVR